MKFIFASRKDGTKLLFKLSEIKHVNINEDGVGFVFDGWTFFVKNPGENIKKLPRYFDFLDADFRNETIFYVSEN